MNNPLSFVESNLWEWNLVKGSLRYKKCRGTKKKLNQCSKRHQQDVTEKLIPIYILVALRCNWFYAFQFHPSASDSKKFIQKYQKTEN